MTSTSSIHQYIDKIIYINLDKRTDRRTQIESQLVAYDLSFERFSAIPTPGFGIVGCGYSHLQVLKMAKENKWKNILILEDDFIFLVSRESFENNIHKLFDLESKLSFDVCFLAYNLLDEESLNPPIDFVRRALESSSASAYIVNEHYYDALIELYSWAIPKLEETQEHWIYANDQIWKSLQKKDQWIYFVERIGRQSDGFSDNANCYMNYNC